MNEPTVSPCWLPVGENHAGGPGESRCSTAAKDGSLAPSVRRHPCLELQWGGWAPKIWRLVHWSCSRLSEPSARAFLGMDAAVKVLEVVDWLSWTSRSAPTLGYLEMPGSHCNSHSARGGDLDAGHCPPCCSEALADNKMPPAPLGQVGVPGRGLATAPACPGTCRRPLSPPPRARIYYSSTGTSSSPSWTSSPSPVPPKLIDPLAPRAVTLFGSSFHRRNLRCRTSRSPKSRWGNPAQMGS